MIRLQLLWAPSGALLEKKSKGFMIKKEKVEHELRKELQCKWTDKKSWSCSKISEKDNNYWKHHHDSSRANNKKNKIIKNDFQPEIIIGTIK